MAKKVTVIEKITMLVLLFAPILWIYGNPGGWSFETMATLPLSVFFFFYYVLTKGKFVGSADPLPQGLILYFIYWTLVYTVSARQIPLSMIQAYLAFFLFFATFDREYFIKIYKAFALVCIVFFFMQEISVLTTGIRISGTISFLPKFGDMTMSEYISGRAESARSSSFFAEPAHFAQFLLPLFAIEVFYDKSKLRLFMALAIGATLLFLRSGNGLLGLATVLVFLVPYYLNKRRGGSRWLTLTVVLLFVSFVGYEYINSEMGEALLERQGDMSMDYEGGSRSGFLRIWRGFFVYGDYSVFEKIFGCPDNNAQLAHVFSSGMFMDVGAELYFNAFQKILLNTGLVGVVIFIYVVYRLWHKNSVCGKAILLTFIGLSFISAIYMTHTMILFMLLAASMKGVGNQSITPLIAKRKRKIWK